MKEIFRKIASALLFAGSATLTVVLTVLCLAWFRSGFLHTYAPVIASIAVTVEVIYILAALLFWMKGSQIVYKSMLTGLILAAILLTGCFVLQATGFLERIDSVEDLRAFIDSRGSFWAPIIFIVLQAMQVFLLPLPGVLTVGAGVLLFGAWETCLYSYIGILLGSVVAFAVGRVVGYRAAAWLVGKESLDKWLQKVKGKDRRLLTVMFILPIFPDDILCFVAGLSTMTWKYFFVMQLISRALSVAVSCFSIDGRIIPYDTPWGIALWVCIGLAVVALFIFLYKKGDKFEQWVSRLLHGRRRRKDLPAAEKSMQNADGSAAAQKSDPAKHARADTPKNT